MSFGFVYSRDIFRVEGFPYKDQIQESFRPTVYGLLYVFPTRNIVKGMIYLICAESAVF